jgi:hypothetical protein
MFFTPSVTLLVWNANVLAVKERFVTAKTEDVYCDGSAYVIPGITESTIAPAGPSVTITFTAIGAEDENRV